MRVALAGLQASHRIVDMNGFQDLADFFRDLSLNWRGWAGMRIYESLEGDLAFSAEHDGHIRLSFTPSQVSKPQGWSLAAEVILDPGEELTVVTQEVEILLAS